MSERTFADDALTGLSELTTFIMSAQHDDHAQFIRAIDATNALRAYFLAIRTLQQLTPLSSGAGGEPA